MATPRPDYIDPGEGTGHTYHSLNAWEDGEDDSGDLVSADEYAVATCRATDGDADVTGVTIDGWTTDATRYIKIWTDPAESYRHAGVWDAAKYRLTVADANAIDISEDFVRIDGIQVQVTSQTATRNGIRSVGGGVGSVLISNTLVQGCNSSQLFNGIIHSMSGTTATTTIWNCIVYNLGTNGSCSAIQCTSTYCNIYGCTCIGGSGYGLYRSGGTLEAKNTYAKGYSGYSFSGTIAQTTCAAADTTAADAALDNIAVNTTNFTNVTAGSEDFRLPIGSALIDVGTDLGAAYNTDIIGAARGATWDIGAFEYVEAGGDPEGSLIGGKLIRGGLLMHGVLVRG